MILKKWDDLPKEMQTKEVEKYYDILKNKRASLFAKRLFDVIVSLILLVILSPVFAVLAIAIKLESAGPVFYRQVRITAYNQEFKIFKFRSMVDGADKGHKVTTRNDSRITRVGKFVRKCRLDEISQLIDVLRGTMTFVGTRPEVPKYTERYTAEMMATLLLPAGVTSLASIYYKDEDKLLSKTDDIDKTYVEEILPGKMYYNLKSIEQFSFFGDIKIMIMTVLAVFGKEYRSEENPKETVALGEK